MARHKASNSLIRALNVINTALARNSDCWPWSQVVAVAKERLTGERLVVAVEDDRTESDCQEQFLVQLRNDRFCMINGREINVAQNNYGRSTAGRKPVTSGNADWNVTTQYLDDLASRATYYVEHPARIGLEWLTDRLGISQPG